MGGIGHNRGPALGTGRGWQTHCWSKARADLLPQLPLQIVRLRVKRAARLGLDYPTYATVRASTGRDIVAFLFSSNALGLMTDATLTPDRAAKLGTVDADRLALVHRPLDPDLVAQKNAQVDQAAPAPLFTDSWARMRDRVRHLAVARGIPGDAVLVVGDTMMEQDWAEAAKMAGYLPAARYFAP